MSSKASRTIDRSLPSLQQRMFLKRAVFGNCSDGASVLNGIRTLCTLSIVLGHVHFIASIMLDPERLKSLVSLDPTSSTVTRQLFIFVMSFSDSAVDIFLFLSSFVLTSRICTKYSSPAFITTTFVMEYMFLRWLRLIPLYLIMVILFGTVGGVDSCVSVSELFFARNLFVDYSRLVSPQQFCLGHGWFVNVDFQSHLLILIVLIIAPSWRNASKYIILLSCLLTILRTTMWIAFNRPVSPISSLLHVIPDLDFVMHVANTLGIPIASKAMDVELFSRHRTQFIASQPLYFGTLFRAPVAMIGGWFGIAFAKQQERWTRSSIWNGNVSCTFAFASFFLALLFNVCGFRVPFDNHSADELLSIYHSWWYSLFQSAGRSILACGLGLFLMAVCDKGPQTRNEIPCSVKRAFRFVFGNRILVALSRSCYAVYLFHVCFFGSITVFPPRLSKDNYSYSWVLLVGLKVYFVTAILCIPLCMLEEVFLLLRMRLIRKLRKANK